MAVDKTYPEIRDAVAKLCGQFSGEYWRKLDQNKAYPKGKSTPDIVSYICQQLRL